MLYDIIHNLDLVRHNKPLVHHFTNFVTMDLLANGVLALGALPVMSHGTEEIEEMVSIASSIVINIGTLDEHWVPSFKKALHIAKELKKPVILDPVGAGATTYRTQTARDLLSQGGVSIVRGNASEIMALAGLQAKTKGVDSTNLTSEAAEAAQSLVNTYNTCVTISGKQDAVYTTDTYQTYDYGSPLMAKVTGMGCLLTSVIGCFHAVNSDPFFAASHAAVLCGVVGEIAESQASVQGPASFKVTFLDQLHNIDSGEIKKRLKV